MSNPSTDPNEPTHSTHPTHPTHPTYSAWPTYLAGLVAIAAFVVGVRWGTFAAGGSDSSCYLNDARLLSHGTTHIEQPLIVRAPWPHAEWTFTPAGFRPSQVHKELIVPICPAGLPLLMAAFQMVHVSPLLVVPICGALAVWLIFVLGRRLSGPLAGAAASVLLVCSPIFLFQIVQPMTDVPAATAWLLVAVLAGDRTDARRRPFAAGIAASIATLIRPNLLPLAVLVAAYVAVMSDARRSRALALFLAGLAPGTVGLLLLQRATYGSPFANGYGAGADLFHAANVVPNLARYGRWLLETHTPILAVAIIAPFIVRRAGAWLCLLLAAGTLAAYLPYQIFDDWWYLRFLIPSVAFLIVLTTSAVDRAAWRFIPRFRNVAVALLTAALGSAWIVSARERGIFDLRRAEHHFVDAGTFAAGRLPDRAAILTVRHSGSVYFYSQRPTVSWDTLEPGSLDRTLTFLRAEGLVPILLLDRTEEPDFRTRFGRASETGQLDWPPLANVGRTIRVYDPSDRPRYFAGATIQTIDWPQPARF